MCGLIGLFHNEKPHIAKSLISVFDEMLYVDAMRGWDSTGVALCHSTLTDSADIDVFKRATPSSDFLDHRRYHDMMSKYAEKRHFWIGHNRAATKGSIKNETAHPFMFDDVCGVHNGTLYTWKDLTKESYSVDSQAIIKALDDTEDPTKVIENLDGAFALIWYDARKGKTYAARNDERPLFALTCKHYKVVILGSEEGMLRWIAERNSLVYDEVYDLTHGTLFEFDTEDPREWISSTFTPLDPYSYKMIGAANNTMGSNYLLDGDYYIGEEVVMKVNFDPSFNKHTQSWVINGTIIGDEEIAAKVFIYPHATTPYDVKDVKKGDRVRGIVSRTSYANLQDTIIIHDTSLVSIKLIGPKGEVTQKEWDELTKTGCSVCSANIYPEDSATMVWGHANAPVCPDCVDDFMSGVVQ